MAITIEIYERTGSASSPIDTLVNNMNWKSQSLSDNLYKYYYYPIRRPLTREASCSVPKYIFAKISGTYSSVKRVRWRLSLDGGFDENSIITLGTKQSYETPTNDYRSDLSQFQDGVVVPLLSTTGPGSNLNFVETLQSNQTYYTDFLVSQFVMLSGGPVGNSNMMTIELMMDEFE